VCSGGYFQEYLTTYENYGLGPNSNVPQPLDHYPFYSNHYRNYQPPNNNARNIQHYDLMYGSTPDICWDIAGDAVLPYWANGTAMNATSLNTGFNFKSFTGQLYNIGNTALSPWVLYPYAQGNCTGTSFYPTQLPKDFNQQQYYSVIWPPMDAVLATVPYTQFVVDVANQLYRPSSSYTNVYDPRILSYTSNSTVPSILKRNLPTLIPTNLATEAIQTESVNSPRIDQPLPQAVSMLSVVLQVFFVVVLVTTITAAIIIAKNRNHS